MGSVLSVSYTHLAGLIPLAVIGTVIIGIIITIFANVKYKDTPYILVVNLEAGSVDKIEDVVKRNTKKYLLKSKVSNEVCSELIYEVRVKNKDCSVVDRLLMEKGVSQATLVSYNGEYMS